MAADFLNQLSMTCIGGTYFLVALMMPLPCFLSWQLPFYNLGEKYGKVQGQPKTLHVSIN